MELPVRQRLQAQLGHLGAAQVGGVGDVWPDRGMDDHALPGAHGGRDRDRDRRHAGGHHLDAGLGDRPGVQGGEVVGERVAQHRDAAHVGIAGVAGVQRRDGRSVGGSGARLVGLAEAKQVNIRDGERGAGDVENP